METEAEVETPKLHFIIRPCQGCIEDQPNQLAHYGGCMPDMLAGETWDDLYYLE